MGDQIVAARVRRDERPQFGILDRHLFKARAVCKERFQIHRIEIAVLQLHQFPCDDGHAVFPQRLHQTEEAEFRRVRNKGEYRVFDILVNRLQNIRGEMFPEPFTFLIDIRIRSPGEVDAFEGAAFGFGQRRRIRLHGDLSAALDDDGIARRQFMNPGFVLNVEGCLNDRTFGGDDRHFIIGVIECRPDSSRIAQHECVSVTDQSCNHESSVPVTACVAKNLHHIQMFGDECLRFASVHAFPIALLFHPQRGAVEEMTDFLQNRDGVRPVFGVLSDIDEPLEEFFGVGQIEISRDDQSSCHPVAFTQERMACLDTVSSIRSVSEMSEEEFSGEASVSLDRGCRIGLLDGDIFIARRNIELDIGHSGAVLSAVVLFFHQQTEFVETVEGCSIFFLVEAQGLQKADHCNTAFMFDRIAHFEDLSGKLSLFY